MVLSPTKRFILGALVLAALAGGVFLFLRKPDPENNTGPATHGTPGFQDVAREAGLHFRMAYLPKEQGENFKVNLYDHGCGVAVADFDGDGYDDIFFVNQLGRCALYKNQGDGTFVDVAKEAGVALGDRVGVGASWGDYDNDGLPDLYVTSTRGGNVLFKNLGQGKFKNVTKEAGVSLVAHCQTAVFFDYDNDGLLDLFVTATAQWTSDDFDKVDRYYPGPAGIKEMAARPIEGNVLFRNNGNGTFTDVTDKAGLKGKGWAGDAAVFDFDEDGWLDVLVTNMFGAAQLYRNNGKGAFTDVAKSALGPTSFGAVGAKAFDFNNDGKLDLFIADMHSDMWVLPPGGDDVLAHARQNEQLRYQHYTGPWLEKDPAAGKRFEAKAADLFKIKYADVIFGNTLFKNLGGGKFVEMGLPAGMETFWPWGIATGDFNNDGHEDAFIPSGMGYPYFYWPNRLKMNQGDETFAERSREEGIEPPRGGIYLDEKIGGQKAARSSRSAAVADFRNAGRLDVVTNNFNDHPYYFRNQFPKKNWIQFRLEGAMREKDPAGADKKSNRDAIGALVRIHVGKEVMVRQVHPAGGFLSQSSRTLHFGLGERTKIDRVEISWPSGRRQEMDNPGINQLHRIEEAVK